MEGKKSAAAALVLIVIINAAQMTRAIPIDCTIVTALIAACSPFVTYGAPDPYPGSPCCQAMASLNNLADGVDDRHSVCRCIMGLITLVSTYNPNATAIATLPGFCGVPLGFTIYPHTDCNNIP